MNSLGGQIRPAARGCRVEKRHVFGVLSVLKIPMKVNSTNSQTLARDAVPPITIPTDKTLLDMLYYMKLTRELEFRIERKLYRQGKIVGGVYVGCGQEALTVGSGIVLWAEY